MYPLVRLNNQYGLKRKVKQQSQHACAQLQSSCLSSYHRSLCRCCLPSLSKEDPRLVVVIFSCCGSSTTAAASTATAWCGCFLPTGTGGKFIKAIVLRLYLCHRMFVLRQKAATTDAAMLLPKFSRGSNSSRCSSLKPSSSWSGATLLSPLRRSFATHTAFNFGSSSVARSSSVLL